MIGTSHWCIHFYTTINNTDHPETGMIFSSSSNLYIGFRKKNSHLVTLKFHMHVMTDVNLCILCPSFRAAVVMNAFYCSIRNRYQLEGLF